MTVAKTPSPTLCARAERSVNISRPGKTYCSERADRDDRSRPNSDLASTRRRGFREHRVLGVDPQNLSETPLNSYRRAEQADAGRTGWVFGTLD